MKLKHTPKAASLLFFLIFCLSILSTPSPLSAEMSSSSYRIPADVIDNVGGESGSTNFLLQNNMGEFTTGRTSSTNYGVWEGFLAEINTSITMSLDSYSVNLGTVAPAGAVTGATVISVTTDAWNGYTLSISENHALLHTDTVTTITDYSGTIATPTTWSGSGFGFTITAGTNVDAKWGSGTKYAGVPTVSTQFHAKTGYYAPAAGSDSTTVGYKVSPPANQKSGTYTNVVTYSATAAP